MEPSWFVSRLRESVARHGDAASSTLDILGSLPIEAVRRNIAAGLRFAADRGREPWRHQTECMAAIERQLLDESRQPNAIVVMPTGGGKTEIFIRTTEASGLDAGGLRLAVPTIVLEPTRQRIVASLFVLHRLLEQRLATGRLVGKDPRRILQFGRIAAYRLAVRDNATEVQIDDQRRAAARTGHLDLALQLSHAGILVG